MVCFEGSTVWHFPRVFVQKVEVNQGLWKMLDLDLGSRSWRGSSSGTEDMVWWKEIEREQKTMRCTAAVSVRGEKTGSSQLCGCQGVSTERKRGGANYALFM